MPKQPTLLIILDGFGYSPENEFNAVAQAHMPHFKHWLVQYPHTLLRASGTAVGLPPGYIGNSEVGHLTIGAGRIIKQPLTILNEAIEDGSFFQHSTLQKQLGQLAQSGTTLHIMGLLSDAGVHSHVNHLYAFLDAADKAGIKKIVVHAFLDGRDVLPQSARHYLEKLQRYLASISQAALGSLCGRFYAMDRDNNWERTVACYDMLTSPKKSNLIWQEVLKNHYDEGITDEFIPPTPLEHYRPIQDGDGIIFFNFRPDRARQLTRCFVQPTTVPLQVHQCMPTFFTTPISYDHDHYPTTNMYTQEPVLHTLKDKLSAADKSIFIIAETEKYAHVTYFFTGGREEVVAGETRILIPSIAAQTYEQHPEMSASHITDAVLHSLRTNPCDFYLINYANPDMVAHSGNMNATIKALNFLDTQLQRLYKQAIETMKGTMYITADHGNAEDMYDPISGQPKTAHTTNQVYFLMIRDDLKGITEQLPLDQLANIAPFICAQMNVDALPPKEERQRS